MSTWVRGLLVVLGGYLFAFSEPVFPKSSSEIPHETPEPFDGYTPRYVDERIEIKNGEVIQRPASDPVKPEDLVNENELCACPIVEGVCLSGIKGHCDASCRLSENPFDSPDGQRACRAHSKEECEGRAVIVPRTTSCLRNGEGERFSCIAQKAPYPAQCRWQENGEVVRAEGCGGLTMKMWKANHPGKTLTIGALREACSLLTCKAKIKNKQKTPGTRDEVRSCVPFFVVDSADKFS